MPQHIKNTLYAAALGGRKPVKRKVGSASG